MSNPKRDIAEVIETLDVSTWDGAVYTNMANSAAAALEDGKVLYFPGLVFPLSSEEPRFLSPDVADLRAKNVSFDPNTGALKHAMGSPKDLAAIECMMRRYSEHALALVRMLLPRYAEMLKLGRTSFRPVEISRRALSPRKDDTRLHIDAFPSTPTGGNRILRVFTNVNPDGEGRHWLFGAPFEDVAMTFASHVPSYFAALARVLSMVGATKSFRTAYDHVMLKMHDTMKADEAYQHEVEQADFSFPPGSTWIVYTDKVSHAAMGGQHLFEQTFYLPVSAMVDPSKAPLRILERLAGRALV
jgi:3-deoxy-D-manno-octulosonic acid hydroxylase-like protein